MSVRITLVAVALLAGLTPGASADPARELPAAGCHTIADVRGDAHLLHANVVPAEPDLDILSLTLRSTSTSLVGYVHVVDLQNRPALTDGHLLKLEFRFGGTTFTASGRSSTGAVRDALAGQGVAKQRADLHVTTASGTARVASGLTVTFDTVRDFVVFVLPIPDVVRYSGRAFAGRLVEVVALSMYEAYGIGVVADSTIPENTGWIPTSAQWAIGDNRCFSIATKLALSVLRYPASRTVTARLTSSAGQVLAGQPVAFYVNGARRATVVTSSSGGATLTGIKPGSRVEAVFGPTGGYLGTSARTKV